MSSVEVRCFFFFIILLHSSSFFSSSLSRKTRTCKRTMQSIMASPCFINHPPHRTPTSTTYQLKVSDLSERMHKIRIKIPQGYPNIPPTVVTSLPTEMKLRWFAHSGSLKSILRQFQDVLQDFNGLWSELAEFDQRAWVLEPTEDMWSGIMRRVAITANTSIQVILDAAHPRALPECHLLGPDHTVAPLRERFNASASTWNAKKQVYPKTYPTSPPPLLHTNLCRWMFHLLWAFKTTSFSFDAGNMK